MSFAIATAFCNSRSFQNTCLNPPDLKSAACSRGPCSFLLCVGTSGRNSVVLAVGAVRKVVLGEGSIFCGPKSTRVFLSITWRLPFTCPGLGDSARPGVGHGCAGCRPARACHVVDGCEPRAGTASPRLPTPPLLLTFTRQLGWKPGPPASRLREPLVPRTCVS